MQVLCMIANDERADATCPTCGQKYKVYFSRQFAEECEAALVAVHTALEQHHAVDQTAAAHPSPAFNVPAWSGPAHMSAAALLSGAPVRRDLKTGTEHRLVS